MGVGQRGREKVGCGEEKKEVGTCSALSHWPSVRSGTSVPCPRHWTEDLRASGTSSETHGSTASRVRMAGALSL